MGRIKNRHVVRLVAETIKNQGERIHVRVFKGGGSSHRPLHILRQTGQKGGVTILWLHKGDRSTSGGEVADKMEQIMRLGWPSKKVGLLMDKAKRA